MYFCKKSLTMKNLKPLVLLFITIGLISCDADDDLPEREIQPIEVNPASNFNVAGEEFDINAGIQTTAAGENDINRVQFIFIGDGLEYNTSGIVGRGPLVQLVLYRAVGAQLEGTFSFNDSMESGTASLAYSEVFDVNNRSVSDDQLESGDLTITRNSDNTLTINLLGITEDGQEDYSLFYEGEVYILN
jgi:hypothetical protein